jgi:hypothetical protein
MYIAKLKDGTKKAKKTFSMILERVFEMVWWRGRNRITSKKIFEVEETVGAFFLHFSFSFFFFFLFFPFFYAASLEYLMVLMIFEEKITSSNTSF